LREEGFEVLEAGSGQSALALNARRPHLVLLDLRLPDMNGLQLLQAMRRSRESLAIVVLSRVADEDAKVEAFDLGADDYVVKPFGIRELLARVRTALRHQRQAPAQRLLASGDLVLNIEERAVKVGKREITLSRKECQLLHGLMQHAGKALSHRFLLGEFWGGDSDPQLLRVFIRALRQKIEVDPEHPQYILTQRGVGYRFRGPK
jgi:two-component system, OmpR family, KDP operon response regulator KdpE